ncbi:beta-L-arabinofuranosidase domain-containing protein [Cellulomonas fengjieae]|uniref:beta-L-arabinofuranosidase domain-containing protein n=1 Tax=Cellulomonas fengjieae TaxID=2819978 RepID=UPI001AAE446C|nr:beta-L-arabinofuranosidase domain-containing protein [Cellulomonas fengjieae]MBO3102756.1 glycoside hydrolase family 127 protein [Cellulomonas fengjieae]
MTSADFLPLSAVELGPGLFRTAQERVRETLLGLSVDRLLAPFRREVGLPPVAASYDGWESSGLDGHTAGHVLSALSSLTQSGYPEVRGRAEQLVAGLRECQVAGGTGYVGGIPGGGALWDELRTGDIRETSFHLNDRWVPLYNLHKTVAGLVDAVTAQVSGADAVLTDVVRWWERLLADLDDAALARVLVTESGGLVETFARVAELTGEPRHLATARRLLPAIAEPLVAGRDELDGQHANTQAPVAVGLATVDRVARSLEDAAGDEACRVGAQTFWTSVARRRSVAIGAASVRENFHSAEDFSPMFTGREGPESCLTYNMVKLSAELFRTTGDDDYLDVAERALVNHLLSTQHPDGGFVYFTSMRPGHYRSYSAPEQGFWCCVGTGLETPTRHGAWAFSASGDELGVNLLLDATARWRDRGVTVRVSSGYPLTERVTLEVTATQPTRFTLAVRIPSWVGTAATATIDAERTAVAAGSRLRVDREWAGTTTVDLVLPAAARLEQSPDGGPWAQALWGPLVLAERVPDDTVSYVAAPTRMGHVAGGPLRPLAEAPVLGPGSGRSISRTPDGFTMRDIDGLPIVLEPFATLHDARYVAAWPFAPDGDAVGRRAALQAVDQSSLSLAARTLDEVAFGEQQPEVDHGVVGSGTVVGREGDERWRSATGDIRLTVLDWRSTATSLRLEWLSDTEPTALRVVAAGQVVLDELLEPDPFGRRVVQEVGLPLGRELNVEIPVVIHAGEGRSTPRLLGLRLLAAAGD